MEPLWLDGTYRFSAKLGKQRARMRRCRVGRDADALLVESTGSVTRIFFSEIAHAHRVRSGWTTHAAELQTTAGTIFGIWETRRTHVDPILAWITSEMPVRGHDPGPAPGPS